MIDMNIDKPNQVSSVPGYMITRYNKRIFHIESEIDDAFFDPNTRIYISVLKRGNRNLHIDYKDDKFMPHEHSKKRFALDPDTYKELLILADKVAKNDDFPEKKQLRELLQEIDISL